jgi:hypothetical protein
MAQLTELNARDRKAGVFQLDLPLSPLKPGFYTCQINIIDDAAGLFLFPRLALPIRRFDPIVPRAPVRNKGPIVGKISGSRFVGLTG